MRLVVKAGAWAGDGGGVYRTGIHGGESDCSIAAAHPLGIRIDSPSDSLPIFSFNLGEEIRNLDSETRLNHASSLSDLSWFLI